MSAPTTRRNLLASALMGVGLLLAYGTLAVQALMFVVPRKLGAKTRRIFIGTERDFEAGGVRTVRDLQGNEILVRRAQDGFVAFSSVCPHLGCRVHWQKEQREFFCPCHRGVFDADGVATAGPPADAGQRLARVNIEHDTQSGTLYLEVKAAKRA